MALVRHFILPAMLFAATATLTARAQTFPGTVSNVRNLNTAKLLQAMNKSSGDLVLVAAHRGYWRDYPENSTAALQAAFDAGIEIIEVDIRLTSDQHLAVSHDINLNRLTSSSGSISSTSWATISGLSLLDRFGHATSYKMLQFSDVLDILSLYNNGVTGPVVIVDIKDKPPLPTYELALQVLNSYPALQQSVVFKMKMKNLPDISVVQEHAKVHPSYGHIVPTINPEDATANPNGFDGPDWDTTTSTGAGNWSPSSPGYQQLLSMSNFSPPFVQQFEINAAAIGDGLTSYIGQFTSFATYYQPSFFPEGVSFSSGDCCYLPDPISNDLRGVLPFALFYNQQVSPGVSLITTDKLDETLGYLVSSGLRNVSEIQ